ncbi:MAG: ribonuclease III [Planctomycetaceae bacterium]|nr:ribonuclease III [Planctomycetaceae bacterium]
MSRFNEAPADLTDHMLAELEEKLRYQFSDKPLLRRCMTHASAAPTRLESNERLEFLGDSILGAVVCEVLFARFPESPEGELTRIKSVVVSRDTCAEVFESLDLMPYLILGRGITVNRSIPRSVLATVFEALVGGIVLDGGYEAAKTFLVDVMDASITAAAESSTGVNFKSLLQQHTQKQFGATPTYKVQDEKGPDHSKCFCIAAVLNERIFTPAWGASKKAAEQRAAENALAELDDLNPPHPAE